MALAAAACAIGSYEPMRVELDRPLPADAFARCRGALAARYRHLAVTDEAGFRLQTEWVAGGDPDVAGQQRATVFRDGAAIACIVEARYVQQGWFDALPSWSSPRPDAALEAELGDLLARALAATAPPAEALPAGASASASASANLPSTGR